MTNTWDERYSNEEYIYGEAPNVFFVEQLNRLSPGKILLPCEGEGRNAVYAATKGWNVSAFDSSEVGRLKAIQLARKKDLNIEYIVDDALSIKYPENSADSVAFIYAHFPPNIRTQVHQMAISWLKPGGKIILEAFNPNQLKNNSGGPKDLSMLYTVDLLKDDFNGLIIELLQTLQVELSEGKYHEGTADVIRFVGTKE